VSAAHQSNRSEEYGKRRQHTGKITRWCKDYFDVLHPYSAGGAYVSIRTSGRSGQVRREVLCNFQLTRDAFG